jgi:hypothetical protein
MPTPLQIFISSPGDVIPERRRARLVIEKLTKIYARFFSIKAIQWEIEPMMASGHFQDQITPPGETDIVVLIVWSRLGTALPAETATRTYRGIDGRTPVTGTEWEFEDALAAQKMRGAPDLLAYRKATDPTAPLRDKDAKLAAEDQWDKLETFWNRWFVNQGQFLAAFSAFSDLDAFEAKLEADLRSLIERRIRSLIETEQGAVAATWLEGSPFRGLEAYRFEHEAVFFGRSSVTKVAVEQLSASGEASRAFLLVLGASGTGKSSLAQAGIVPALTGRGIVPQVGLWRRSVVRPASHPAGPFVALAEALAASTALPELVTTGQDAKALARHLRASASDPAYPIVSVLNRIEDEARRRGELLSFETARVAVVIDQLEELFTVGDLATADRIAFIACLEGLAKSGRVFVIATMRSDYWHRAAETPLLVDMAGGNRRLDLLAPTQEEIIEMIRQPAEAAGLAFDDGPNSDIKLDARLAADAANEPGALPLLSFLLDELYKKDIGEGTGKILTHASMEELGGLNGAIATRAETVFASLPPDVKAALPDVLRLLVTVSRLQAEPVARPASMAQFAEGSPERTLVERLLDPQVRLLVAEGDGEGAYVRLAHEALITHWHRASEQIAQDREDLRTRAQVEEAFSEWKASSGRSGYLLRDPLLANARDLSRRWGRQIDPAVRSFIQNSRRRAYARTQFAVAALAVLLLAVGAAAFLWIDDRVNQVRTSLQDGRLETAQAEFLGLDRNPAFSVMPKTASARALSTQFLDDALTEVLLTLPVKPSAELNYHEQGQLVVTNSALFGLSNSPTQPYLFRCTPAGADCSVIALELAWYDNDNYYPLLLRSGDDVYLMKMTGGKEGPIAQLPNAGALTVASMPISDSKLPQLKQRGKELDWISPEQIVSLDGPLSQYGPLSSKFFFTSAAKLDDDFGVGTPGFKVRPQFADDAKDVHDTKCDAGLWTCIAIRYIDASFTIAQFDLWTGKGDHASEGWSLDIAGLFSPPLSRNARAISRNGEWIAISADASINIWHRPDLNDRNRQPYKVLQLGEIPTAVSFEESTQSLLVLTRSRLLRVNFEPRAKWAAMPKALRIDREAVVEPRDGLIVTREVGTHAFIVENLRTDERWPIDEAGGDGVIRGWAGIPVATIGYSSGKIDRTLVVDLSGSRPSTNWVDGHAVAFWRDGQSALFTRRGCDLLLWRAPGSIQALSLAAISPKCVKSDSFYAINPGAAAIPFGKEGMLISTAEGRLIKIGLSDPEAATIEEINPNERKVAVNWDKDQAYYFNDKAELVVLNEQTGFDGRRITLPAAAAEMVLNTIKPTNPVIFNVLYAGSERYVLIVDDGKCEIAGTASLLLIDASRNPAEAPYLLRCVNGVPADPRRNDAEWAMNTINGINYIGHSKFDGVFRWSAGGDLLLDVFNPRGIKPGGRAVGIDTRGERIAGTNTVRIDLSRLNTGDANLGATTIAASQAGDKLAFFKAGIGTGYNDLKARLFDLSSRQVDVLENASKTFFDFLLDTTFSPDGRLLLTNKRATGYELFQASDLRRLRLPPGVIFARFAASDQLRLTLSNGGTMIWSVPEANGAEYGFLSAMLRAARDNQRQ